MTILIFLFYLYSTINLELADMGMRPWPFYSANKYVFDRLRGLHKKVFSSPSSTALSGTHQNIGGKPDRVKEGTYSYVETPELVNLLL